MTEQNTSKTEIINTDTLEKIIKETYNSLAGKNISQIEQLSEEFAKNLTGKLETLLDHYIPSDQTKDLQDKCKEIWGVLCNQYDFKEINDNLSEVQGNVNTKWTLVQLLQDFLDFIKNLFVAKHDFINYEEVKTSKVGQAAEPLEATLQKIKQSHVKNLEEQREQDKLVKHSVVI
jgi:hypothetical protein